MSLTPDEVVQEIENTTDDGAALALEQQYLVASDNGWHEGDPVEQPEQ